MTIDDAVILALGTGFTGAILWPGDDAYEDARKVHNGMIDRRSSRAASAPPMSSPRSTAHARTSSMSPSVVAATTSPATRSAMTA